MAFRFINANCVAIGAFNMHILQPEWLQERNLIERGAPVDVMLNMSQPGLRFRVTGVEWTVGPTKIEIGSADPSQDLGEILARALDLLQWTPLVAVGINNFYRAAEADLDVLPKQIRPLTTAPEVEGYELASSGYRVLYRKGEKTHEFRCDLDRDAVTIAANTQQMVSSEPTSEKACRMLRSFFAAREQSEQLLRSSLGVEVVYGNDDAG